PFFFVNDTATTEIYTLSLHDALPICPMLNILTVKIIDDQTSERRVRSQIKDRKSTRLNSSHVRISYAVFCLEKRTCVGPRVIDELRFDKRQRSGEPGALLCLSPPVHSILLTRSANLDTRLLLFFFFLMRGDPRSFPLFPYPPHSE